MRIVIGEDETLMRDGLVALLRQAGFGVVGVAADATTLVSVAADTTPDLVLTDIQMPPGHGLDGLRAALTIRAARPGVALVVLSQHVHRSYVHELVGTQTTGVGYLLKQRVADVESFVQTLRTVADGGLVLDPEVVEVMLNRARRTGTGVDRLTPREHDTLRLVAEGLSNRAIGRALGVSERAVVNHVTRIYDKLELYDTPDDHRRVRAVIRYLDR